VARCTLAEGHHDAIVRAWAAFGKIGWKRHTALCCRRAANRSREEREGWGVLAGAENHRDGPGATARCRLAGSTTRQADLRKRPFSDIRCPDRVATKPPLGPMHGYPKTRSTFWTLNTSSTSPDSPASMHPSESSRSVRLHTSI